jgi:hypothetical protein
VLKLADADVPPLELDGDLKRDFDVMRVTHARASEYSVSTPSERDVEFIRTVRDRLDLSLSLEVFIRGIRRSSHSPPTLHRRRPVPTCALSILKQDGYTLDALHRRLAEFLAAPARDEVAELRIVSRKFTKYGY